MEFITMVAYMSSRGADETPWRCVACDKLTPISEDGLFSHMAQAHGWEKATLRMEGDALFLRPPDGAREGIN